MGSAVGESLDRSFGGGDVEAQNKINAVNVGVAGKPNVAGFPNAPSGKRDEPNGDMIMAATFLMEQCGFQPDDFDGKKNRNTIHIHTQS